MLTPLTAFAGVRLRWPAMMRLTCIGILAQFALLLLAFGVLTYCFLISDFSVIYVAQHSYSLLSWEVKVAAVWGGHEGSVLLWV
ncbi:heme lyase NrfEFG subunit NrfE, partial [Escherichia coli]|nr:heme lyase NrfEFG subunit NrfE [Escherichia coli]